MIAANIENVAREGLTLPRAVVLYVIVLTSTDARMSGESPHTTNAQRRVIMTTAAPTGYRSLAFTSFDRRAAEARAIRLIEDALALPSTPAQSRPAAGAHYSAGDYLKYLEEE